jgi:hypothetical protein
VKHFIGCIPQAATVSLEDTMRSEAENSPRGFQAAEAAARRSEISTIFFIV